MLRSRQSSSCVVCDVGASRQQARNGSDGCCLTKRATRGGDEAGVQHTHQEPGGALHGHGGALVVPAELRIHFLQAGTGGETTAGHPTKQAASRTSCCVRHRRRRASTWAGAMWRPRERMTMAAQRTCSSWQVSSLSAWLCTSGLLTSWRSCASPVEAAQCTRCSAAWASRRRAPGSATSPALASGNGDRAM